MAPYSVQAPIKSLSGPAAVGSVPVSPQVLTVICFSILLSIVVLSTGVVLIYRCRNRTECTTQLEAQVPVSHPVEASEDQVHHVFISSPTSSKACHMELPLSAVDAPDSLTDKAVERPTQKSATHTDEDEEYPVLPPRCAREAKKARAAMMKEPWVALARNPSATLDEVDAAIVAAVMNPGPRRSVLNFSEWFSTMGSISSRIARNNISVWTTTVPTEDRPLEVDVAGLPKPETAYFPGSLSSRTISRPVVDPSTTKRDIAVDKYSSKTPCSPSNSVASVSTKHGSSYSSDAETVYEVDLGSVAIDSKQDAVFLNTLSSSISASALDASKRDAIGWHSTTGSGDPGDAELGYDGEEGDLGTLILSDSHF